MTQLIEATSQKVAGSVHVDVIVFFIDYGHGVTSASNRNEYKEYFLRVKGGRCIGLITLPQLYVDCLLIWETQPPGALRDCTGIALTFIFLQSILIPC